MASAAGTGLPREAEHVGFDEHLGHRFRSVAITMTGSVYTLLS